MTNVCSNSVTPEPSSIMRPCIAFLGEVCLVKGTVLEVAAKLRETTVGPDSSPVLVFDAVTSRPIELDLREDANAQELHLGVETSPREPAEAHRRGPGRPKLGVVAREVTLLPRHWDWLATQPGGASVALRKLVETARRELAQKDEAREASEAVYRFMLAMAGDRPGYEEALRAFYARNESLLQRLTEAWPPDIREHLGGLVRAALGRMDQTSSVA